MLSPAMEAALDPASSGRFALLAQARDLWSPFSEALGPIGLDRCGALLKATRDEVAMALDSLSGQGAEAHLLSDEALFTPEDWRLEPRLALAALTQGYLALGGDRVSGEAVSVADGEVRLADGAVIAVDHAVLACGYGGLHLAPELGVLRPIKGQLLRFGDTVMNDGPIVRGQSGYVVPGRDGPVCGATMEEGVSDLSIDPDAIARLRARAALLAPQLAGASATAQAGVRAATPDGLPLVGRSVLPKVWIAAGARRDGWLLGPMIALQLAAQIAGEAEGDPLFDPARFS
jgi:glycine oxidase